MKPPRLIAVALTIVLGCSASAAGRAAVADDLRAALVAGGSRDAASASPKVFLAAFSSVLVSLQDREVPACAAAALKMRPDLLDAILDEAVAALSAPGQLPDGKLIAALASATVKADPTEGDKIVARLTVDAPESRAIILASACEASPAQSPVLAKAGAVGTAESLVFSPVHVETATAVASSAPVAAAQTAGSINPLNVSTPRKSRPPVSGNN